MPLKIGKIATRRVIRGLSLTRARAWGAIVCVLCCRINQPITASQTMKMLMFAKRIRDQSRRCEISTRKDIVSIWVVMDLENPSVENI